MPVLLGLWWLGATTSAPLVPVVLPGGEAVADWQRPLSLCESYRLTPSAAAPTTGPVVQIRSTTTGWAITVRDERGDVKTNAVSRADRELPREDVVHRACSLLSPSSGSVGDIPLPKDEVKKVKDPIGKGGKGGWGPKVDKPEVGSAPAPVAKPTPAPPPPPPPARPLAPGEQLDGLMPAGAAGVCACSWITDDSDLRSDDARWSFAPSCDTCEPTAPLEIPEEIVNRRPDGRR